MRTSSNIYDELNVYYQLECASDETSCQILAINAHECYCSKYTSKRG